MIKVWTDGACSKNPGVGGWAYIIEDSTRNRSLRMSGSNPHTTNNKMELTAVIKALKKLKNHQQLTFYIDSQYVINGITQWLIKWKKNNWRKADKKPVLNLEHWQEIERLIQGKKISWNWVKAHADNKNNEACDQLAKNEIKKLIHEKVS